MIKSLKDIVKEIKFRENKTTEELANELGYERAYFTTKVNANASGEIRRRVIDKYKSMEKQNVQSANKEDGEDIVTILREQNKMLAEQVKLFSQQVAISNQQVAANLSTMMAMQQNQTALLKVSIRNTGMIRASIEKSDPEEVLEQINKEIADEAETQKGIAVDSPGND